MPFTCPECLRSALAISLSLELPPDARSDEITVQVVSCAGCGFEGLAVYEESRRGGFDSEVVDHRGYRVPLEAVTAIRRKIARCPNRRNPRCRCATHTFLGKTNAHGRWVGLRDVELGPSFPMVL